MTARDRHFEVGVEVRVGAGSATIVDAYWDCAGYLELAEGAALLLGRGVDDLVFLDGLDNGGERGAGLAVLREAVRVARVRGRTLVVQARSERGGEGDQERLRSWYERTGLLEHVPGASAGRVLSNLFYDAGGRRGGRRR